MCSFVNNNYDIYYITCSYLSIVLDRLKYIYDLLRDSKRDKQRKRKLTLQTCARDKSRRTIL